MSRATTKSELITSANEQYNKLFKTINSMSEEKQNANFLFEDRDKNIRDVLVHLYEWHMLLLNWVDANLKGENKPFLPAPYNWKTYPDMNVELWKKHQKTAYKDAINMLQDSHQKVMALIEKFSNDQLFTKKFYSFTGTTNLGAYCISATASHYDWAIKKIKKHINSI